MHVKNHQEWIPLINQQRCVGCEACIDYCPTDALKKVGGKATLAHPNQCIYCLDCEEICPEGAIEIPLLFSISNTDQ